MSRRTGAIQLAHTAELDVQRRAAARALLDDVFGAEMSGDDWDHALGGVHALAWEDGRLVGHGAVIQRRLLYRGRAHRAGYIEAIAVRAERRRLGYGAAIMDALEKVVRGAYDLGALGTSEMGAGFYAARGWKRWRGQTWALTPYGPVRTIEEDDSVYVLEVDTPLDTSAELTCDWRDGDVW